MKRLSCIITLSYILFDYAGLTSAWILYNSFLISHADPGLSLSSPFYEPESLFLTGLFLVPLLSLFLFALAGFYSDPLRRSRLLELGKSLAVTLAASMILYLLLVIKGAAGAQSLLLPSFLMLFLLLFLLTYLPRLAVTSVVSGMIHKRKAGFRTLIVGSGPRALSLVKAINEEKMPSGNLLTGFVSQSDAAPLPLRGSLPHLGSYDNIAGVIEHYAIEEVVMAMEEKEYRQAEEIIDEICYRDVIVRAVPSMQRMISAVTEAGPIYATPLLRVSYRGIPQWQGMIKQILDYLLSALALIILSPLTVFLSLAIWLEDKGPVLFRQERTGRHGKPFTIFKFRSMITDAESHGPRLATRDDNRVTYVGRFMRKHRLDEIPNFINVIRGEMSLVGPRPERSHYIRQIRERASGYNRVLAVKPGITCWGQVKLGYASDLESMIERLSYDQLYLENASLFLDLKIIFYTLGIIIRGTGQ